MSAQLQKGQGGIVLIEVLIATVIFAIGILAVIGLQASAIASVADSKFRMDASAIANRTLGAIWAKQTGLTAGTTVAPVSELPNGTAATTLTPVLDPLDVTKTVGYAATVLIQWQPPNTKSSDIHRFSAVARIYSQ